MFSSKQTVSNDSMFRCHFFSKTYSMKQYNLHVFCVRVFFFVTAIHHSNARFKSPLYTHALVEKWGSV